MELHYAYRAEDRPVGTEPKDKAQIRMQWVDFQHGGKTYSLAHLVPVAHVYRRVENNDKPSEAFRVDVTFSLHCFSRRPGDGEVYDSQLMYPNVSEQRLFDLERYEMSKRLPEIIASLPERKIRQTGHGNYISVDLSHQDGTPIEYDVFFKVKKVGRGKLELRVESAYVRDAAYQSNRPSGKPIRFWVILHNTLNGLAIRT